MSKRALITGAAGMLGQDLERVAAAGGFDVVAFGRRELDITDGGEVDRRIGETRPDVVINCAAWTDVDGAEGDYAGAVEVNGAGAGNVARAAAAAGAWIVHVSSDYVFDGAKSEPYLESDRTGPLSAYGNSKLEGERAVAAAAPGSHTIVRSSWLFGAGGRCFPDTILRLASERDEIAVVDDQVGSPTFTGHLAQALVSLAAQDAPLGVLHVAGAGACSWYEFATQIVALGDLECAVRPIPTSEMPRPAARPVYSALGSERPEAPRLPAWRSGLEDFIAARVGS